MQKRELGKEKEETDGEKGKGHVHHHPQTFFDDQQLTRGENSLDHHCLDG